MSATIHTVELTTQQLIMLKDAVRARYSRSEHPVARHLYQAVEQATEARVSWEARS